jgi:predicted TIM-barrel fold metal-dependent hydrolase
MEPPELWRERIDPAFSDRAPHLVSEDDGDWWYSGNHKLLSVSGGTQAGLRFQDQAKLGLTARMGEVVRGAYDPTAKISDMDADGIQREVVYPTLGLRLWRLPDTALLSAIFRAYNDWIADFCRSYPDRLAAVGLLLLDDIDAGVAELRRMAGIGMSGAMISVYPGPERSYDHPMYEPLWVAASELDIPLSLHIATNRVLEDAPSSPAATKVQGTDGAPGLQKPTQYATSSYWVQCTLADMIFAGVFERFPELKVVSLEYEAAWAATLIQAMDYTYTQRARRESWYRFKGDALPSDFYHRNVYISFQEDALGIRLRDVVGIDNLVWGSDYPHAESTFPHSRKILGEMLADVPFDEQKRILDTNPTRLYHFG